MEVDKKAMFSGQQLRISGRGVSLNGDSNWWSSDKKSNGEFSKSKRFATTEFAALSGITFIGPRFSLEARADPERSRVFQSKIVVG